MSKMANQSSDQVLEALLVQRHSCRAFRPDPVPRPVIERMFELAQRTASWCNTQPWRITVTEGSGTERFREALYSHAAKCAASGDMKLEPTIPFPTRYSGIADQRRKAVGKQLYDAVGISRDDRVGAARQALENFRFFGAPHVLLIHVHKELGTYGAVDCGLYLGTLLLAAESLGISMIPQAALASYPILVREHFAIPDGMNCLAGASFGYAERNHPANSFRAPRATVQEAVTWISG
jgi:nitroreductase